MTRREIILNLTAELRQVLRAAQIELEAVKVEIEDAGTSHWRRVRLSDRAFDLRAKIETVSRMIDAKVDAFIKQEKAAA